MPTSTYDVCIAGAGFAGITLALDLASRGRRVILLEAGGLEISDESQDVYRGVIVGRSYFPLEEARLRFLGGTSNHWAGWCRPLDAYDFEQNDHIPTSGWPLTKAALDLYIEHACSILEIDPDFNDLPLEGSNDKLMLVDFKFSPPVRFGEKFIATLEKDDSIDVFLNANLVNIGLDREKDRMVAVFECANYKDSNVTRPVNAINFVLALGGIETPRVMLNCRSQMTAGIGNETDLVGRFFMEHMHAFAGVYVTNGATWRFGEARFAPTRSLMMERRIGNAGVRIDATGRSVMGEIKQGAKRFICSDERVAEFVSKFRRFDCPDEYDIGVDINVASEQVPNRESRVYLSENVDRFELRRVALDWRITEIDRRTIKESVVAIGSYFAAKEMGNIKLVDWLVDEMQPVPGVEEDRWLGAGWHHMGTTRMAVRPEDGVVDRDCRVFGLDNLYIAGSSVFPTGGHANPTLTIVQLALRLSEHLDRTLGA